jgi:hypothetical protein
MHTTQEKIAQYVGIKYGEDIANELTNKTTVTVAPPVFSAAILLRHQEWDLLMGSESLKLRFGALLGPQLHHRSVLGGDYEVEVNLAGNWIFSHLKTPPREHLSLLK